MNWLQSNHVVACHHYANRPSGSVTRAKLTNYVRRKLDRGSPQPVNKMADDLPLELCPPLHLFLVPQKKINVAVVLPTARTVGPSISNWDMMEKLRQGAQPEQFVSLRVEHSSRERINFIGELPSLRALRKVVLLLNGKTMRMPGFAEPFKVKAFSLDVNFPKKKDWEAFYRSRGLANFADGSPGERPDTVRVSRVPVEWFNDRSDVDAGGWPSKALIAQAFSQFGAVSNVGVYLHKAAVLQLPQAEGAFSSFGPTPSQSARLFDAFLQFADYNGFCSCMLGLKGVHMMRDVGAAGGGADAKEVACIEVDYDRSGFMTVVNVRRREVEEAALRESRQQERERREEEERLERERRESKERAEKERKQEERRQRREARQQRHLEKEKQKDMILQRLKVVSAERHTEAQRLLRVLLSGAAEQVYQEERAEQDAACSTAELRRRVRELERRRRALERVLSRQEAQNHA